MLSETDNVILNNGNQITTYTKHAAGDSVGPFVCAYASKSRNNYIINQLFEQLTYLIT